MRNNKSYQAVTKELDKKSITYTYHHGTCHPFIEFTIGERRHRLRLSKTPSDHRSWLNDRTLVRRMIRGQVPDPR